MPLLIGIILLALGISLAVAAWSPAFLAALQVFGVMTLLFCGVILTLVGYSAQKAERAYADSTDADANVNLDSDDASATTEEAPRETSKLERAKIREAH